MTDYNADDAYPQNFGSASEQWTAKHLIIAHEIKNVAITGTGVINGSGDHFFVADGALSKWNGSFCERNNRNLTVKNCVFPQ